MILRAPITFLFIGLILLTFFRVRLPAPTTFHIILDASFYLFDKVNALVTRLVIALTQLIFQPIRLLSLPSSLPTPAISANGNLRKFSLHKLNLALLLLDLFKYFAVSNAIGDALLAGAAILVLPLECLCRAGLFCWSIAEIIKTWDSIQWSRWIDNELDSTKWRGFPKTIQSDFFEVINFI